MPDVDVGPESLRAAAQASRELAAELRVVDPGAVNGVQAAMPNSTGASHAEAVNTRWETQLKGLEATLEERAEKLAGAAEKYDGGERATVTEIHEVQLPW